jgi:exodeoxyribonuclease-3
LLFKTLPYFQPSDQLPIDIPHHPFPIPQETKISGEDKLTKELVILDDYESYWAISKAKKGYSGVTTYTKVPPRSAHIDDILDSEGRTVILDLGPFILINVYIPNSGVDKERLNFKMDFLAALKSKCDSYTNQGREVMIVGDLNLAADARDVHPRIGLEKHFTEEERAWLKGMLTDSGGYTDIWRKLHNGTNETQQPASSVTTAYTCWDEKISARAFNEGVRIDYILLTSGIVQYIKSCEIMSSQEVARSWSDHAPLKMHIDDELFISHSSSLEGEVKGGMCEEWKKMKKRFIDSSQKSIPSMFGKMKRKRERDDENGGGEGGGGGGKKRGAP